MARVFSALPARALHGRPPDGTGAVTGGVLLALIFGPMLGFLLAYVPPFLVTDWQVRGTALTLQDGTVPTSDCSTSDVLAMCDMTVAAPVGAGEVTRHVYYMFLSGQDDPVTVHVVADPAHPDRLTTDLGLDVFWNRVASLCAATLLLCGFIAVGAWGAWRSYRRRQAWRKADSIPVSLRLVTRQRVRGGQIWTVRSEDGQIARYTVSRRAEPFTLGSASEILGLQRMDGTAIMPLDATLRWVDLTPAERQSVFGRAQGL